MESNYLTVSALTKYIKYKFDNDRHLLEVLLQGEISNFKHHSRGHFYFTLKDENAQISAMMFSSNASKVKFEPKDGMKVFVKGSVTVYEASGNYQIVVREMKSDGVGDLYLAYEELKKKLEGLGYFDPMHKVSIPLYPKKIGIITSPTGAAIRDIINTISRRYPLCELILYPALVQGEGAKDSVASQIIKANEDKLVDTLIVGRGGGSIEDLWAFNEMIVAKAIYDSKIPIISAVGHEIDFTIADFVADMRAATPTAAAELATPNIQALKDNIIESRRQMDRSIKMFFNNYRILLGNIDRTIENNNPKEKLRNKRREITDLSKHLKLSFDQIFQAKKNSFQILNEKLKALNPLLIMDKGFSIATVNEKIIRKASDVKINDDITVKLKNGNIKARVVEVNNGK